MRSLFGNLHPTSGLLPLSDQPQRHVAKGSAWLWALVCLAAGAVQAASLAWPPQAWAWPATSPGAPSGLWQVVSLAVLVLALLRAQRVGQAAWRGWLFAWSWLACTFSWLFVSMHTYGGLADWMAVLAVLALAGGMALFYAGAACAMAILAPRSRGGQVLLFAALWTMAELARGSWFTGLPWGAGGYAQADTMSGLAPWVGVYGMGALAAMLAYALAIAVHWLPLPFLGATPHGLARLSRPSFATRWLNRAVALALVALLVGLQWNHRWQDAALAETSSTGDLNVWLLQGNIAQNEKFETGTGVAQALAWYPQQIADAQAAVKRRAANAPQLVVAPETAIPMLPQQLSADAFWRPFLRHIADQPEAQPEQSMAVLVGLPLGAFETGYTNSAWGITSETAGRAMGLIADAPDGSYLQPGGGNYPGAGFYRYSKHHLVPFGEFIPPWFRWFTDLMHIPLGDFARGATVQPPWALAGQRVAPNICYEDLFGEELAASFRVSEEAPTVLVNLSNIAWFGDMSATDQHLQISRLRAMELGRPMLRATNTGATAVIDHRGTVTHLLPRTTQGRLEAQTQGRSGLTPFAQWAGTFGLWPAWALCGGVLLMALLAKLLRYTLASAKPRRG
ncbi:apolipoprotein N-acyltransferase [Hydrogenophaga crassostreae]|uniref:apolipoprotein N-acyltransferase n=1 Tax=Hydrogenophaga crassostreae TaxID=1763535 RepID=UPI0009EF5B69|nr:apolipoprotein N-acyltransferase [Hydrogenophaga crassostreae]